LANHVPTRIVPPHDFGSGIAASRQASSSALS
jgi:hypothetical protein